MSKELIERAEKELKEEEETKICSYVKHQKKQIKRYQKEIEKIEAGLDLVAMGNYSIIERDEMSECATLC